MIASPAVFVMEEPDVSCSRRKDEATLWKVFFRLDHVCSLEFSATICQSSVSVVKLPLEGTECRGINISQTRVNANVIAAERIEHARNER
jgi:hypothetical protein